ncbi:vWA domain-containing protein [Stratiformator vulcanicus]|uniref:VWFA domain-containing protein n=1 Tax=Stratiformator vulcanicus TaxID=2527980 RepID=A0A517R536_9PLAN|nr:vWA domain-containing protein [Stratiformator vulcanicus]QDT38994.1 hypothetical protein Pan189_33950 [Stratiformator vulcanicus]
MRVTQPAIRSALIFAAATVAAVIAAAVMTLADHAHAQTDDAMRSPVEASRQPRPRIEVVFVLDSTGSMSGLIAAAKEKIWAIANSFAQARPAPEIKMGLVGYRDRGDEFVTKVTPLTDDLDEVYANLMALQAGGGGDTPESVNQALSEAVGSMKWSNDETTYKVIYLVGDAPPHLDYKDDTHYKRTCEAAVRSDLIINTIQCGQMSTTTPIWQEIADLSEGRYVQIDQSGGHVVSSTPFDKQISELSEKLDGTRLYYGTSEQLAAQTERNEMSGIKSIKKQAAESKLDSKAWTRLSARRALFNSDVSGGSNFLNGAANELVHAFNEDGLKLSEIDAKQLPEDLRKLPKEQLEKELKVRYEKRKELRKRIRELGEKRQKFIESELAKRKDATPVIDVELYRNTLEQAGKKGIQFKSETPAF